MIFSNFDIDELKKLQPKLNTVGNRISGCFYLSASLSKGGNRKITICKDAQKANYLSDCFYLDIIFHKIKAIKITLSLYTKPQVNFYHGRKIYLLNIGM
ncbi:hypothetical protein BSPWISOXPB_7436 [uncultured Gammaproteobacteria bacterium]|nr:hypothetical protein BSPWISOXPB_7436 [uncultured Gammaproteobacteria bacterium]